MRVPRLAIRALLSTALVSVATGGLERTGVGRRAGEAAEFLVVALRNARL
jgi:hypothetical protein